MINRYHEIVLGNTYFHCDLRTIIFYKHDLFYAILFKLAQCNAAQTQKENLIYSQIEKKKRKSLPDAI